MKKQRLKKLTGAFAFVIAALFFGAPSSPAVAPVPTVGGDALAYYPQPFPYPCPFFMACEPSPCPLYVTACEEDPPWFGPVAW